MSGVTDWSEKVSRAGTWWVTTVKIGTAWTIIRSSDGVNWTNVGHPSFLATTSPAKVAIDDAGKVYTARVYTSGVYRVMDVATTTGGAWTVAEAGKCGLTGSGTEGVGAVLASGSSVAIVTDTRRCVVTSRDRATSWRSGKSLTGGSSYYLADDSLYAVTCGQNLAFGVFDLVVYDHVSVQNVPLIGCDEPALLDFGLGSHFFVSRQQTSPVPSRATIIFGTRNHGVSWQPLAVGEPMPMELSPPQVLGNGYSPLTSVRYGIATGTVLLHAVGRTTTSIDVRFAEREIGFPAPAEPARWMHNPVDPGLWQSAVSGYVEARIATKVGLAPPQSVDDNGTVDGLALVGDTLFSFDGDPAPIVPPAPVPLRRSGAEIEGPADQGSGVWTSHTGAWSAYAGTSPDGTHRRVFRVRPDGTVEDTGPMPLVKKLLEIVVADNGTLGLIGTGNDPNLSYATVVAYWYSDSWYGAGIVAQQAQGGQITATAEFGGGMPQVHLATTRGTSLVSADFGVSWSGHASLHPVYTLDSSVSAFSAPYQFVVATDVAPARLSRRQVSSGALATFSFPAGHTVLDLLVGPNDPGTLYAPATTATGFVLLKSVDSGATWTSSAPSTLPSPATSAYRREFAMGPDGKLHLFATSDCPVGTTGTRVEFVVRWRMSLIGGSFSKAESVWWGLARGTHRSGGWGDQSISVPARPDGAVDERQLLVTEPWQVLVVPASLSGFQGSIGASGQSLVAGGVGLATGNFTWNTTDVSVLTVGAPLDLRRTFNGMNLESGMFGPNWSTSYDMRAVINCGTGAVTVRYPDGRSEEHTPDGAGGFTPPPGFTARLSAITGGYRLTQRDGSAHEFNTQGRLSRVLDGTGRAQTLTYNASGQLTSVSDVTTARSLTFTWTNGLVTQVATNPVTVNGVTAPLVTRYGYVGGVLERACSATNPDLVSGHCTLYTTTNGRLSKITDSNGHVDVAVGYDANGRVVWREDGTTARTTIAYTSESVTLTTDPAGVVTRVTSDSKRRLAATKVGDLPATTYTYDANGYPISTTYASGRSVVSTYDARGNVLTRNEGTGETHFTYDSFDNLTSIGDARSSGPNDVRYRTTFTWDAAKRLPLISSRPATAAVPTATTTMTYTIGTEAAIGGGSMPANLLRTEASPTGSTITYSYDNRGNLRRVVRPSGLRIEYTYDELGRMLSSTEYSDTYPAGVRTDNEYDAAGRPTTQRGAPVTNPVTGLTHRLQRVSVYDSVGNLLSITTSDIGGSGQPDPTRQTTTAYDAADRPISTSTLGGGTATTEYDAAGRVCRETDVLGRIIDTRYDNAGRAIERLYIAAPAGPAANQTIWTRTLDADGKVLSQSDALGRTTTITYDPAGRPLSTTLSNYVEPGGTTRPVTLFSAIYDPVGRVIEQRTAGGLRVEQMTYDAAGRLTTTVLDPAGLHRVTTQLHDGDDRIIEISITGDGRTESQRLAYDNAGRVTTHTVENGAADLVTTYGYDQRDHRVSAVAPNGNSLGGFPTAHTTTWQYDQNGRLTTQTGPQRLVSADGVNTTISSAATTYGYNTFGDLTHARDPRSNVTTIDIDQLGRPVQRRLPAYTTPGGVTLAPTDVTVYDHAGNITSTTDRRNYTTTYAYDYANRLTTTTGPATGTPLAAAVWTSEYDQAGQVVATVDPTGARNEFIWDALGRQRSRTEVLRVTGQPTQRHTTTYSYDDLGNMVGLTSPEGRSQQWTFNAASEITSWRDGAGQLTSYTVDVAGRTISVTDPLGRRRAVVFDLAGRAIETQAVAPTGTVLARTTSQFDANGNLTKITEPEGFASGTVTGDYETNYSYDSANQLVGVSQSPGVAQTISQTYRYDAAGNLTGHINGRTATTTYAYNSWNLAASVVEPSTPAHPAAADRTWTTTFDAGGLPVQLEAPGAITTTRSFDAYGQLISETAGSGVTAAQRSFGYNAVGRMIEYSAPDGTVTVARNDRGQITSTTGVARLASTMTYTADGLLATRTSTTGTAAFTWTDRAQLATMDDPASGQTLTYSYNNAGQTARIDASGGARYEYTYDDRGLLASETIATATVINASRTYTYDRNGNLNTQDIVAAGNPQAGQHTYTYDWMNRLTTWTGPSGTVPYGWDTAGNRTLAGSLTATYDARNRLTSIGTEQRTYDPRGVLATVTNAGVTTTFGFDGLGRLTTSAGRTLSYDSLDRLATLDTTTLAYPSISQQPTAIGTTTIGRTPDGRSVSSTTGGTSTLAIGDRHGDISTQVTTSGNLAGSAVYDPFGNIAATTGETAPIGFQGDLTDAPTGNIWMHARWYTPTTGAFTSRDTWAGQLADPVTTNRYSYANNNPTTLWDPTGHSASAVASLKGMVDNVVAAVDTAQRRGNGDVSATSAVPLLSGRIEVITATNNSSLRGLAKQTAGLVFTFAAGALCATAAAAGAPFAAPVAAGAAGATCAGAANRLWNGAFEAESVTDWMSSTFNPRDIVRDVAVGAVTGGTVSLLTRFAPASSTLTRLVVGGASETAAGGLADTTAVLLDGGTFDEALQALLDPRRRFIDFTVGAATGHATTPRATKSIPTPYGAADQGLDTASVAARSQVENGATVYRIGTTGRSAGPEGQFWSLEHPSTPGYSNRYGLPAENVANADFIESAVVTSGSPFVTRAAPGIGDNVGGGIEVVVNPGGVTMCGFSYLGPKGC
jgi:RHS repeat-associated protein